MKTIRVNASESYDIYIGHGLIKKVKDLDKNFNYLVLTDENVEKLHLKELENFLDKNDISYKEYIVKAGEDSKSFETLIGLLDFMAENGIDFLIAFGGGVVGDLGGFAAAIFKRGISYLQIPTTLLSQVDSSVGGKTAINLKSGKNLVGSFKQPKEVICDLDFLSTLSDEEFACGMGEVIKYGILFDKKLFEICENKENVKNHLEEIVGRCIELKKEIVEKDEFDKGQRQLLNLGHTLAHGIEIKSDHEIKHGQAVAIGTFMVAKSCEKEGFLSKENLKKIEKTFVNNELPIKTSFSVEEMMDEISKDKKKRGKYISEILINDIGDSYLKKFELKDLEKFLQEGE